MRRLVILHLCFCTYAPTIAQYRTPEIDSILNVIETVASDSVQAHAHSRLSWLYAGKANIVALAHNDTALSLFKTFTDLDGLAFTRYRRALLNRLSGDYKKGLENLQSYSSHFAHKKDTLRLANGLFQVGVIHSLMGNYEKSLKAYYENLAIYEALKMDRGVAFTLNSIGIVNKNLKNYDQAAENFKKAIEIHKRLDEQTDLANAYSNLGEVYWQQDSLETAEEYFLMARKIDIKTSDDWGLSINNQKIGRIHYSKGNFKQALAYLDQAHVLQQKNNFKTEIGITLSALGLVHLRLGNFKKSEALLKKGLSYVPNSKGVTRDLYHNLYKLYKETGRDKMALDQYELYVLYKDSLIDENRLKDLNELQIRYETEKKDKELAEQQLEIQQSENQLQKKQTQYSIMTGIAIFLFASCLLGWFLYQQRQKRKNQEILTLRKEQQVKTLESLIQGEEKERLRIAKELHDGVNGDLSAIKYKLSAMAAHNTTVVNEVVEMLDRSSEHVRAISHNLVPPALEKFDIIEALEDYATSMNAIHVPEIHFQFLGDPVDLSKNIEINLYRIVQELVSNSIKHAQASEITVQISHQKGNLLITVEDNGVGFDTNQFDSNGIGLKNIHSRIDYLKAKKDLVSNDRGTTYSIEIDTKKLNDH